MRFSKWLVEKENDIVKKVLSLEDPNDNEEYTKKMVIDRIETISKAIDFQKKKVDDINDDIQNGILSDMLKKLRKWKNVLKVRWPKDSDDDLSPVPAKPTQPPIDMGTKMPIDLLAKMNGVEDEEDSDKEKPKK